MDYPLVSVLMPAYNAALFLKESIESILNQTYKNFELIIINDGSSDHTEEIINSYKDYRISYFKTPNNNGLVSTLNRGLLHCKGEFIARMDADDWAYPKRLEIQINYLLKNPDIDICGANIALWDGEYTRGKWIFPVNDTDIKANLFLKCSMAHPTIIFRQPLSSPTEQIYNEQYYPAEDYELWVRLMAKKKFHNINKTLLKYRINPNQISYKNSLKQSKMAFKISWEQVLNLNLSTEHQTNYKKTHHKLIIGPWPKEKDELIKLISWLKILKCSNEREEKFDKISFNHLLGKKLWEICFFLSSKKINSYGLFYQSKFNAYYTPPYNQKLISFIKNSKYLRIFLSSSFL